MLLYIFTVLLSIGPLHTGSSNQSEAFASINFPFIGPVIQVSSGQSSMDTLAAGVAVAVVTVVVVVVDGDVVFVVVVVGPKTIRPYWQNKGRESVSES